MSQLAQSIYPWQQESWLYVTRLVKQQRLPHAFLLAGPEETGKQAFAEYLAAYMVCRHPGEVPCGSCKDCLLYQAGTHPDIVRIVPGEKYQQIKIQAIRDVVEFLGCRSNQGGYRIVIISPAEGMNVFAANALLKSLEEPGENTLILLISQRPESLLPTIRSRCQQLPFPVPPVEITMPWLKKQLPHKVKASSALQMAQGRPLAALRYVRENETEKWILLMQGLKDITEGNVSLAEVSERWKLLDILLVFQRVILLSSAMVRAKMADRPEYLRSLCCDEVFYQVMRQCDTTALMCFHDWLIEHYGMLSGQINLNTQLLVDALLVRWRNLSLS